jgi:putative DNA primase/helicase
MITLRAAEIHARIGPNWPQVMEVLGLPGFGTKKPRPCPLCGGKDRFVPDNRRGRGDYFCRGCGAGDGFKLLMGLYGWTFATARQRVMQAAGLTEPIARPRRLRPVTRPAPVEDGIARPSARVHSILRSACAVADCEDAVRYLKSRKLWPLPEGCTLRAHPSVEYFDAGNRLGRYAALIAAVRDLANELVTVHLTYLQAGAKLTQHAPRKLLSGLTGRSGCAARLTPIAGDTLGVCEGIETALAAQHLHKIPVWPTLNTTLLTRFEPPAGISRLVVLADHDAPGLEAAARLMERLQGRVHIELRVPRAPHKDWADVWAHQAGDLP